MDFAPPTLSTFRDAISALPPAVAPKDIQREAFLLGKEGRLAIYYAPVDWINRDARIVLVGLTPGWQQTKIAFDEFCRARRLGQSETDAARAARAAKAQASFAGMQRRMCSWLDDLGVARWLGLKTTDELFVNCRKLVHTTSLIRYPVFVGNERKNYTGHSPTPMKSALLRDVIDAVLLPELAQTPRALIVPLGRSVSVALDAAAIDPARCLYGFPHPSGANGHGQAQFAAERNGMRRVVERLPGRAPCEPSRESIPDARPRSGLGLERLEPVSDYLGAASRGAIRGFPGATLPTQVKR